jgi:NAD-dependent deacetylase
LFFSSVCRWHLGILLIHGYPLYERACQVKPMHIRMADMEIGEQIKQAAKLILRSGPVVALTGAGISVESGIPAFRGSQGLWSKYDPMEYASIEGFLADPGKVWQMLLELDNAVRSASPNPAHVALARLEEMGKLELVITQNIDGLHQSAGSRQVAELHGSGRTLSCLICREQVNRRDIQLGPELPPRCPCGGVLKPDLVFFGEALPMQTFTKAMSAAAGCSLMLVVGTSAVVAPASELPHLAKQSGANILEVNLEPSLLSHSISDLVLQGPAAEVMTQLMHELALAG